MQSGNCENLRRYMTIPMMKYETGICPEKEMMQLLLSWLMCEVSNHTQAKEWVFVEVSKPNPRTKVLKKILIHLDWSCYNMLEYVT